MKWYEFLIDFSREFLNSVSLALYVSCRHVDKDASCYLHNCHIAGQPAGQCFTASTNRFFGHNSTSSHHFPAGPELERKRHWTHQNSHNQSYQIYRVSTLAQKRNSSPFHLQILKWPEGAQEWLHCLKKLLPDFLKFKLNKRGVFFVYGIFCKMYPQNQFPCGIAAALSIRPPSGVKALVREISVRSRVSAGYSPSVSGHQR